MANYVLEILDGDRAGEVLPVTDRTLRIGRKPGNDLVIADEKTSGVHAEVVLEGDRHVLRDLGSTNGTFLDGKRVAEIVLSPGDVVTIGRVRVAFRDAATAVVADAGELAVRRLDAGRLPRRTGSVGLLAALVVGGLGVAGYLWWRGEQRDPDETVGKQGKPPIAVAGNRLAASVGACDVETGWNLRAAGSGFQPTARMHTGSGAFEAVRTEGAEAADFAMQNLAEPLPVFAGRTMTIAGHLRSEGGAQVALRAVCFSANEQSPFRFRVGSPLAVHEGWQRVECAFVVPPGCDRLQVEVVAVLGSPDAVGSVDDVAVVEAGQAAVVEQKLPESSQTLLGTATSLAVRSTDPENPASLLQVLPADVPAALEGLQRAGLCGLSDLGATLAAVATERSFQIEGKGVDALQLVFSADAAAGLLTSAGEAFASAAAESEFTAQRIVLGDRATRAQLQFAAPVGCRGQLGGGLYRLRIQSPRVEIVLGFRDERAQAGELLRQARARHQEGQRGPALDLLRQLLGRVPQDSEMLGLAQALRAEILAGQAAALARLQQDLDESAFFDTRGGFERVALGVDEVLALYGEQNLEDPAGAKALGERARARMLQIDAAQQESQRTRLQALAKAFAEAQQAGLATLVESYVTRHLRAADGAPQDSTPETPKGK